MSISSRRSTANASSGRDRTLTSIALSTFIRDDSRSGSPATSLSKVCSVHTTVPSGGFLSWGLDFFLASCWARSAWFLASDFAFAFSFSMTCSGACTTTKPAVSNPARPARPAIWRNSRVRSTRCRLPSNFASPVNSTVRIGTLMPTPSVSVPQMTVSNPAWARVSTSRRYFGSIPAWCTPMPAFTSFWSVFPNPAPNRNPPIFSAIASLCSRSSRPTPPTPSSRVACSTADACVKCTTYAGACPVVTSSSTVSSSGSRDQRKLSGTGRSASATTAVSRPVRADRSAAISDMSPSVADISTNWAPVSSSRGTCQAQPRSGSP